MDIRWHWKDNFLRKNICCGYSLELSCWGESNEYPQHIFLWKRKIISKLSPSTHPSYLFHRFQSGGLQSWFFRSMPCNVQCIKIWEVCSNEPGHDKTNKMCVCPAKTQINLGIRRVRSEFSLCAQWVAKDPSFLHADSKDSDQTGQMPRLICVFAGCTVFRFVMSRLKCCCIHLKQWSPVIEFFITLICFLNTFLNTFLHTYYPFPKLTELILIILKTLQISWQTEFFSNNAKCKKQLGIQEQWFLNHFAHIIRTWLSSFYNIINDIVPPINLFLHFTTVSSCSHDAAVMRTSWGGGMTGQVLAFNHDILCENSKALQSWHSTMTSSVKTPWSYNPGIQPWHTLWKPHGHKVLAFNHDILCENPMAIQYQADCFIHLHGIYFTAKAQTLWPYSFKQTVSYIYVDYIS